MTNTKNIIHQLKQLSSEQQNPATLDIDLLSTLEIVEKINHEDSKVSQAIKKILPELAEAVDLIVQSFQQKGRLIYLGAGTSGRLAVLDAVECVPTFGVSDDQVIGLLAGGKQAMFKAQEGAEDDAEAAAEDLKKIAFSDKDILVAITASGRTPYVIGAMQYAKTINAKCIALSCNANAAIAAYADIALLPVVGAEVLAGSTRMKSATAQKMVLNILSTASMIRLGKCYQNLMVDLQANNQKLFARGLAIIMQVTGVEQAVAEKTLKQAGMQVKLALLMLLTGKDAKAAQQLLTENHGFLRRAQS